MTQQKTPGKTQILQPELPADCFRDRLLPPQRTTHNGAVIKERHLKMRTAEPRPQGTCDLVQQVGLSFSQLCPALLQRHFHGAAWQRHSWRSVLAGSQAFAEMEPLTPPLSQQPPEKKKPHAKEHLPKHGSVKECLTNVVYNSALPLPAPGLESPL